MSDKVPEIQFNPPTLKEAVDKVYRVVLVTGIAVAAGIKIYKILSNDKKY